MDNRLLDTVQCPFRFRQGQSYLFRLKVLTVERENVVATEDLSIVILNDHLNPHLHG